MKDKVSVLIPLSTPQAYDYKVPPHLSVAPGDFVHVPLGRRKVNGVVWADAKGDIAPEKLKPLITRLDVPPLKADMRQFIDKMADYIMAPKGAVLRLAMVSPDALSPPPVMRAYRWGGRLPDKMTPARKRVFALFEGHALYSLADITRHAGVSTSVVKTLAAQHYLIETALPKHPPFIRPQLKPHNITLSPAQKKVADALCACVRTHSFVPHLLDGVTGSGKTQVYLDAVEEVIRQNRQAVILLPEISLTAQFLERFRQRFGTLPALWHSQLSKTERRRNWQAVANGEINILVGARSALFLPWQNLGLIVVDEEHDTAFKQEEQLIYNARDMAVLRARFAACPIILASATPSLESVQNAHIGRYRLHHLPHRHGGAILPHIELIDMRKTPPARGQWLVPQMVEAIRDTMTQKRQALLFLNRRGFAPLTICRACGHRYGCPSCDAWLVEHRARQQLLCHHCGTIRPIPHICDACGAADMLVACGPGVERIVEEAGMHFPDARISLLSSDHITGQADFTTHITHIAEGGADIIVGTQMVTKGHHFPKLTFVGVVDADAGLGNADLRAAERTYQLLVQVSGRAGREIDEGRVMLQSYMPHHPVLQALVSGTRDEFIAAELQARRHAAMPPFGRLAAVIISSKNQTYGLNFARALAQKIPQNTDIHIFGPAPAPIARLRTRYRFRFLIKADKKIALQSFIAHWLAHVPQKGDIRVAIDIDPYSFM